MTRDEAKNLRFLEFTDALADILPVPPEDLLSLQDIVLSIDGAGGLTDSSEETNPFQDEHYTNMPERHELWTSSEPYYEALLGANPYLAYIWPSYLAFDKSPYYGNNVNLYEAIDLWLHPLNWTDASEYVRGEDHCLEAYYARGFLRAPIPVIPYMVDTFTPPSTYVPSVSVVSLSDCIAIERTTVDGDRVYSVTLDEDCLWEIILTKLTTVSTGTLSSGWVFGTSGTDNLIRVPVTQC